MCGTVESNSGFDQFRRIQAGPRGQTLDGTNSNGRIMNSTKLQICGALITVVHLVVGCAGVPTEQNALAEIQNEISTGQIRAVTVKRVDYSLLTAVAVNPRVFSELFGHTRTLALDDKRRSEVLRAMQKSTVRKLVRSQYKEIEMPDIRLGIYFKDQDDQVRHTIFTNPRLGLKVHRTALIDGQVYYLRGNIISLAEKWADE
jgi:hypothetical protein